MVLLLANQTALVTDWLQADTNSAKAHTHICLGTQLAITACKASYTLLVLVKAVSNLTSDLGTFVLSIIENSCQRPTTIDREVNQGLRIRVEKLRVKVMSMGEQRY
uniref:Rap1-interacting factor 1 N terminal n=1 Tax=Schistocephalus solidus TaxID=70667 RepID=A0A0X3PGX3_SCHSO